LFSWKATGVVAAATVWVTLQAVQKIGQDAQGRTQIGASAPIGPLTTLSFDSTADWADLVINALNMSWDPSDDGAMPAWSTHLCVDVNLIEVPAGAAMEIKALRAFGF